MQTLIQLNSEEQSGQEFSLSRIQPVQKTVIVIIVLQGLLL